MKKVLLLLSDVCACVSRQENTAEVKNADVSPNVKSAVLNADDAQRIRENINVKGAGNDFVIYEYANLRIDNVATLASAYCYNIDPNTKAYLRDIYMTKNHKRRATFDCVTLAGQ